MKTKFLTILYVVVVLIGCTAAIAQFDPIGSGSAGSGSITGLTLLNTTVSDGTIKFTGPSGYVLTLERNTNAAASYPLRMKMTGSDAVTTSLYMEPSPRPGTSGNTLRDVRLAAYGNLNGETSVNTGLHLDTNGGQPVYTTLRPFYVYNASGQVLVALEMQDHNGTAGGMVELRERTDVTNVLADTGNLYVRDNGSGKSQLVVRFASGAVQVLASEP